MLGEGPYVRYLKSESCFMLASISKRTVEIKKREFVIQLPPSLKPGKFLCCHASDSQENKLQQKYDKWHSLDGKSAVNLILLVSYESLLKTEPAAKKMFLD
ncbi:hypothetical protein OPV22_021363 [Ensete ventricosum]|uniref:Uncharacterized protein n=1 Tax=Ensete ventricosum TaxID=4639 RepID=A0AAV8PAS8_ENSVE|nr:hypothetical protein OPV22_021363 [Ensete ventricosum]